MPKKTPKTPNTGPWVFHLRGNQYLKNHLNELADATGKSANELALGALAEFLEITTLARDIEAGIGTKYDPDDIIDFIGPSWISRLCAMDIAGPATRLAWRWHLARQQKMISEIDQDKAEDRKHKEKK